MSFDASLLIAAFIIFSAVFFVLGRVNKARLQAKEDDLRKAAALRGWTFQTKTERGDRIHHYAGTTDGVAWEAESATRIAASKHRDRRQVARWHGKWSPGVRAPLVAMGVPKGKEALSVQVAQGDGVFARLAQTAAGFALDKAIDAYFGVEIGKEVDAATLKHVSEPSVPGFIFMAGDVDEARRVLAEGLQTALLEATANTANVLADDIRPFLLLRSHGISLARMKGFADAQEVERFVRAGVGLTRAFRFGRPA
jgi:hypothetical protein